jgi:hypothetical protein
MTKEERIRLYYVAKYIPVFRKTLKSQNDEFIKAAILSPESAINQVDQFYSRDPMRDSFLSLYGTLGAAAGKYAREKYKRKKNEDQWIDEFLRVVRTYSITEAGERITAITGTSKELAVKVLRRLMEEASTQGVGNAQLSQFLRDNLEQEFGRFERWRADRIVQTESVTAQNKGLIEGAKSLNIDMVKVWNVTAGVSETERHALIPGLNGQRREMNIPFSVDGELLNHPGDPSGSAGNVINCKCFVTFIPK